MTETKSIFVIDDDPITVFGLKKMLRDLHPERPICAYANGKQALEAIGELLRTKRPIPEVIFLDLNMPVMDGWQFLEAFLSLPVEGAVRINIVTSSIDPNDLNRWEEYKIRSHHRIDFHNKPIRRSGLEQITTAA